MRPLPAEPDGPVPAILGVLLAPLYRLVVSWRNRRFDKDKGVKHASVPVICIGNISVGGSGKTPMVRWAVQKLRESGHRPGVVLRGYGPKIDGVSDEEAEHRAALGGAVPVRANPNRLHAISDLVRRSTGARIDCVVLDDGFQHRRVARDADVVLIDATRNPWEDHMLPAGWLREPPASLSRATAVVITHAESVAPSVVREISAHVAEVHGKPPIAVTAHAWTGLRIHDGRAEALRQLDWLVDRKVLALCAIARPRPFIAGLRNAGAEVVEIMALRDHARFNDELLEAIIEHAASADAIVCTEKDWMKLGHLKTERLARPIARPILEHRFLSGAHELAEHIVAAAGGRR